MNNRYIIEAFQQLLQENSIEIRQEAIDDIITGFQELIAESDDNLAEKWISNSVKNSHYRKHVKKSPYKAPHKGHNAVYLDISKEEYSDLENSLVQKSLDFTFNSLNDDVLIACIKDLISGKELTIKIEPEAGLLDSRGNPACYIIHGKSIYSDRPAVDLLVQTDGLTKTLFPATYRSLRRIFKKAIEDLDNKI